MHFETALLFKNQINAGKKYTYKTRLNLVKDKGMVETCMPRQNVNRDDLV